MLHSIRFYNSKSENILLRLIPIYKSKFKIRQMSFLHNSKTIRYPKAWKMYHNFQLKTNIIQKIFLNFRNGETTSHWWRSMKQKQEITCYVYVVIVFLSTYKTLCLDLFFLKKGSIKISFLQKNDLWFTSYQLMKKILDGNFLGF